MKIIHLISGGDVGGAKTHVLSLLQGLTQSHTVQLICFMEGDFAQEARDMGIATEIIKSRSVIADCRTIADLIRKNGYQIVHCHGSRANMMGAIIRRLAKVPVVTTVHSDYRLDYLGRPLHRLTFGTINTIALRFLDYYIGVSEAMAELLIQRGFDPQRMFSIYNGVDFSTPRNPIDREQYLDAIGLKREKDSVVFGIAARISPVKDIEYPARTNCFKTPTAISPPFKSVYISSRLLISTESNLRIKLTHASVNGGLPAVILLPSEASTPTFGFFIVSSPASPLHRIKFLITRCFSSSEPKDR